MIEALEALDLKLPELTAEQQAALEAARRSWRVSRTRPQEAASPPACRGPDAG